VIRCSPAGLTLAEIKVLELVSSGLPEREVACTLCVCPTTVHTHIQNIFRKLGVQNKVSAAVWYVRHEQALLEAAHVMTRGRSSPRVHVPASAVSEKIP